MEKETAIISDYLTSYYGVEVTVGPLLLDDVEALAAADES